MKKYLLAVIMVVMLVSPALAGQMVRSPMVINGNTYMVDAVNQDNHFYVPLRFIAEYLGVDIKWDGSQVIMNAVTRPAIVDDSNKITSVVNQALDLLEKQDPADYEMICRHTRVIEYKGESLISEYLPGYKVYAQTNGGTYVTIGSDGVDSKEFNPTYVAGVLVHEAVHQANQCRIPRSQDENLAFLREIAAFRALGAPQEYIDSTEAARKMVLNQLIK